MHNNSKACIVMLVLPIVPYFLSSQVSEWIIQDKKGLRKFNNFERLLEQDPTGQIVQVGNALCFPLFFSKQFYVELN